MSEFTIIAADDVDDVYAGTSVPGEFRPLTGALDAEQVAVTLIRVPPHSDFEQGTGHFHPLTERTVRREHEPRAVQGGAEASGSARAALPRPSTMPAQGDRRQLALRHSGRRHPLAERLGRGLGHPRERKQRVRGTRLRQ